MPHFIIDCNEALFQNLPPQALLDEVMKVALASNLFAPQNIKVRIRPYTYFVNGSGTTDFLHVFAYIMGGRTLEQRKTLAAQLKDALHQLFPAVQIVSVSIHEFEKESYAKYLPA